MYDELIKNPTTLTELKNLHVNSIIIPAVRGTLYAISALKGLDKTRDFVDAEEGVQTQIKALAND